MMTKEKFRHEKGRKKKTALLFFSFISWYLLPAQQTDRVFPFGVIETLHSVHLKEDRTLNIYLPDEYTKDTSAKFPVVYVLDGSAHEDFPHLAGLAQFMMMYGLLPPSIVVGIANVDRYRDFTFPSSDTADLHKLPTSGGSAAFIAFIQDEAEPFVVKHFRTNQNNTIIGQSLGGLLATEILFKHPQLFDQYIIVSPSLWWNKFSLPDHSSEWLDKKHADDYRNKKVYIAVGNEPEEMIRGANELEQTLKKYLSHDFQVTREFFPHETHATILHRAVYAAWEWLYPVRK